MKRSLLVLGGLLALLLSYGFSCNPPPPPVITSLVYQMSWQYNCTINAVPESFQYGYMSGTTYEPLGSLPIVSCSGLQTFTVCGTSAAISATSKFYVRSYYSTGDYSVPNSTPQIIISATLSCSQVG